MKVVVRQHRPLLSVLVVTLVLVALGAAGWTLLKAERERSAQRLLSLDREHRHLAVENRRLSQENEKLTRKMARIERASQIKAQAYAQVDAHLGTLEEELQAAREEVSFYQGITAESGVLGVRIQRFTVEPAETPGRYRFRLVLTRGLKDDTVFEGSVVIAVDGELGRKAKRLAHQEAVASAGSSITFKFRHFQRIENQLVLPEHFVPKSVTVRVRSDGKTSSELEESFAWPS